MLIYKTFRWRMSGDFHKEIDAVLNALPAGTCIEGYATDGSEFFITVSRYEPYKKEIAREVAKIELQAN